MRRDPNVFVYSDRMRHKGDNSCEIEERLARAAETSLKTKSISPVLREELRLSILNRRHANGQEELSVEFKKPVKHDVSTYSISMFTEKH